VPCAAGGTSTGWSASCRDNLRGTRRASPRSECRVEYRRAYGLSARWRRRVLRLIGSLDHVRAHGFDLVRAQAILERRHAVRLQRAAEHDRRKALLRSEHRRIAKIREHAAIGRRRLVTRGAVAPELLPARVD